MLLRLTMAGPLVPQVVHVDDPMDPWFDREHLPGVEYDLPDELAEQFIAADEAFWTAHQALSAYWRAERRDRESYRAPYRRTRPDHNR